MVSWTPGPWKKDRLGSLVGAAGEKIRAYDAGLSFVMASPRDEDRANASLISAAPELAEALHNVLVLLKLFTGPEDAIAAGTIEAGEAVLAKAKGE